MFYVDCRKRANRSTVRRRSSQGDHKLSKNSSGASGEERASGGRGKLRKKYELLFLSIPMED
jgi:hypothetical protein